MDLLVLIEMKRTTEHTIFVSGIKSIPKGKPNARGNWLQKKKSTKPRSEIIQEIVKYTSKNKNETSVTRPASQKYG